VTEGSTTDNGPEAATSATEQEADEQLPRTESRQLSQEELRDDAADDAATDETEPAPESEDDIPDADDDSADTDDDTGPRTAKQAIQGTVQDVKDWVGDSKRRAQSALKAENEQDSPRATLISHLERLTEK
jgi:hypothetical protein